MTDYLTAADVLAMHAMLIGAYGGAHGLRDAGALEAAVFRPQTGYYDDLVAAAAALLESLTKNHPFIDGNKRAAFAATDVFLRINGQRIVGEPLQLAADLLAMFDAGSFDVAHLDPWLRVRVQPLRHVALSGSRQPPEL
jgi:death on curing protein